MATFTVYVRGTATTFASDLSNDQAIARLGELTRPGGSLARSSFGCDLLRKSARLSPAQMAWVHKLVADAATPATPAPAVTDLAGIVGLLDNAATHLRFPKITLTIDGVTVRVARAGDHSRYPGTVTVTDGTGYGGKYFGRIDREGRMDVRPGTTPAVIAILKRLAADPAGIAGQYGRESGVCCFCGRELTDARSTSVGYGPICADHFGLPWGDSIRAAATTEDAEAFDLTDAELIAI